MYQVISVPISRRSVDGSSKPKPSPHRREASSTVEPVRNASPAELRAEVAALRKECRETHRKIKRAEELDRVRRVRAYVKEHGVTTGDAFAALFRK